jgi:hypothetical protein
VAAESGLGFRDTERRVRMGFARRPFRGGCGDSSEESASVVSPPSEE